MRLESGCCSTHVTIRASPYSSPLADIASDTPSLKTISQSPGIERHGFFLERRGFEQPDDRPAALEPPDAVTCRTITSGGL